MKRLLILCIAVLAIAVIFSSSHGIAAVTPTNHNYVLNIHGAAGVRLHLLLITKTANSNPERREETVVLPATINFKAVVCYAWLDTLPNGASGNEGDLWKVDLIMDGRALTSCNGAIKKQNDETAGVFSDF